MTASRVDEHLSEKSAEKPTSLLCFVIFLFSLFFFFLGGGGVGGVVCCVTFESLVPQPGIDPRPLAVKTQSPTHWIAREFQGISKR